MAFLWPLLAWFWHRVVEQDVGCRTWTKQKCQIHKRPSRESSLASINVPQISSVLPSRECMIFRKMKNDSIRNATQKWKRRHKKKWTSNLNLTWHLVTCCSISSVVEWYLWLEAPVKRLDPPCRFGSRDRFMTDLLVDHSRFAHERFDGGVAHPRVPFWRMGIHVRTIDTWCHAQV